MWYRIMLLLVVIGLCAAPLNMQAPAAAASQANVNCCGPDDPPNPPPPPPTA
ncbi:MAG TPA: hypothetical protein VGQ81_15310 [Acidobacteriota bacterium]|jgi:hypothetical protein|nr:hypothetical protein [Acidobacteriota bacterium]